MNILATENLSYSYHGLVPALRGITLSVRPGECWAVIGANGSGKSTLIQILNGLRWPEAGRVHFDGRELTEDALRDKAFLANFRARVGYVFQDADVQLFCPTVLDEMLYGPAQLPLSAEAAEARAREAMDLLHISHLADRPSSMLSGGEKKRVAVASVLATGPEVLLLDEPMNGLDPRSQKLMSELLLKLKEEGKTMVIATHDLSLVEELDCRTAVLSESHELMKTGPAQVILNDVSLLLEANLVHEHHHHHGEHKHTHVHSHLRGHRHP